MKKTLLVLSVIAAATAQAEHHKKVELSDVDKCYMNAVEKYPGHVLSMESEIEKDRLIYEFDIMTKDGREVEVECDARKHSLHDDEVELKNCQFIANDKLARVRYSQEMHQWQTMALKKLKY